MPHHKCDVIFHFLFAGEQADIAGQADLPEPARTIAKPEPTRTIAKGRSRIVDLETAFDPIEMPSAETKPLVFISCRFSSQQSATIVEAVGLSR